jgi:putative oxidoreductase
MQQAESSIDVRTAPYAAFALRLALGAMFISHGLLKIMVFTPAGTVKFFESLGLPGPLAYVVMGTEVLGGIAILIGLHARWVALALVPILLGSIYPHATNGWLFSAQGGGWEYPAFLTMTAIAQALLGDGKFAITNLITGTRSPAMPRLA